MAKEIERKYLVRGDSWRGLAEGSVYRQGYIATQEKATVRIRIIGEKSYLTIKSPSIKYSRLEFEYPIPVEDAQEILETLCERPFIEKIRYKIESGGLVWEIDEFLGDNEGLITAEIELDNETDEFQKPDWLSDEVSDQNKYYNSSLSTHPFKSWNS